MERSTIAERELSKAQDVATQQELSRSESMYATLLSVVPWQPVSIQAEQLELACAVDAATSVGVSLRLSLPSAADNVRPVAAVALTASEEASPAFCAILEATKIAETCSKASVQQCLAEVERSLRGISLRLEDVARLSLLHDVTASFANAQLEVKTTIVSYARLCKLELCFVCPAQSICEAPRLSVSVRLHGCGLNRCFFCPRGVFK